MTNIHDIRAQLRTEGGTRRGSSSMALPAMATLAVAALLSGVAYYLFLRPVMVPLQPSAAIPTFRQIGPDGKPVPSPFQPQRGEASAASPSTPARYAGLSFRQTGKAADEVCFARAHAKVPHWSKTPRLTTRALDEFSLDDMPHFNELMRCLLTEAPIRYCSSSQRGMIATEIAMYFRVLEYGNRRFAKLRTMMSSRAGKVEPDFGMDADEFRRINKLEYVADQGVTAAIEARLADGTLTKADRESFGAAVPQPVQQRFGNVRPTARACPPQKWWAFWRTL